jgi:YVTN family beta-propeller protein
MTKIKFCALAITLTSLFVSCKKNDTPPVTVPKVTTGLYVLSEGTFNGNNTTLTYYNFATSTPSTDFFATANGSGLGDTGNDIIIYGGKMYIVVNVSSYVEIADALTGKEIKKISFKTATSVPRQPRYAVGYKNKVLVSSYDGTVAVIDTTSLLAERFINVGKNPEQMAVIGSNLYVANSGGLTPGYDSTVSVVDLATYTETKKITVGVNPASIAADSAGNIYVGCIGDYNTVSPKLVKVNATTGVVIKSADTAVGKIRFYNNLLYVTGGYLGSVYVRTLNTTDFKQTSSNFVTDGTVVTFPYGLNIDPGTGDVYVTDGVDYVSAGRVFCFDKTGKKKFSFSVDPGRNPNTVVFIKQ